MKTKQNVKLVSDDGLLVLNTTKNSEWQEWVTTYKLDGKFYESKSNHTDDKTDAIRTMYAIMDQYERTCRKEFNGNVTHLHAGDTYLTAGGSHAIHIREVYAVSIHLEPEIRVNYKWYELGEDGKAISSGIDDHSISTVLGLLNGK